MRPLPLQKGFASETKKQNRETGVFKPAQKESFCEVWEKGKN